MLEYTKSEMLELDECRRNLQNVLRRLDDIGAGIAAIHVNAAIEQLQKNLNTVESTRLDSYDPELISVAELLRTTH